MKEGNAERKFRLSSYQSTETASNKNLFSRYGKQTKKCHSIFMPPFSAVADPQFLLDVWTAGIQIYFPASPAVKF